MLSDYYRERRGQGDPLVVHRHNGRERGGTWPARGTAISGQLGSVQSTSVSRRFLSTCRRVDRRDMGAEWRRALDGPDSGLDEASVYGAAQDLYAAVFANAWKDHGGSFRPGTSFNDVVPLVPAAGVAIVREWIAELDAALPYPLFDLFTALGADADDEGHADPLYYLCMGCIGHGVGLTDWSYDHGEPGNEDHAREILGPLAGFDNDLTPRLDDWQLREVAEDWIRDHPPDPADPVLRCRPEPDTEGACPAISSGP